MAIKKKRIKALAEARTFYDADKSYIREAAHELGLDLAVNESCPDCWRDACFTILKRMADAELLAKLDGTKRKIFLRPGLDVILNGQRYNSATLATDKAIEEAVGKGLPRRWVLTKEQLKDLLK